MVMLHQSRFSHFRPVSLAFHAYMQEGVDAAIIECGIGGEYDSTNIIVKPAVTGITSLGIDHVAMLGNTLGEIAWHKGGIMKRGVKAFTVDQEPEALSALQGRAEEKSVDLTVVHRNPEVEKTKLGLAADFQNTNASIAVAVAAEFLRQRGVKDLPSTSSSPLPPKFRTGLERVQWSGRCETRIEGPIKWYIDGGHTLESIEAAAKWFASQISSSPTTTTTTTSSTPKQKHRILLFNQQTRDAASLAKALHQTLSTSLNTPHPFTHALFSTNVTFKASGYRPDLVSVNTNSSDVAALSVQMGLAKSWKEIDCVDGGGGGGGEGGEVGVFGTVEEAVEWVRGLACGGGGGDGKEEIEVEVLVTGSLHLVGGFLEVLESEKV